jgi:YegS/Rv2252/BmrU family lipid kinase
LSKKTNSSFLSDPTLPLVIVNPKSASGTTRGKWAQTASDLRSHFGPFSVAFTKKQGDGIELAKRGAESGRKMILACGGDGTINEVVNGILQSAADIEFGVIPSGTGGDFRRTLGLPGTIRESARALRDGVTEYIDVGKVTFDDFDGKRSQRFFVNVSSFGLAASILQRVKGRSALSWFPHDSLRGRATFALSTLQEIVGVDCAAVQVKLDEKPEKTINTINFCVANARFFGGGMKIAPNAKLTDGQFDVVNIGDISTARIIMNAHTLYRGTHMDLKEVKNTLASRIEARAAVDGVEIHLEMDGELPGKLPALFEIVPRALKMRVPRQS